VEKIDHKKYCDLINLKNSLPYHKDIVKDPIKMLPPECPSCGDLLSNIQLAYQADLERLCEEMGIDIEILSRNVDNEEFNEARAKIVSKYIDFHNYCSKMHLMTFCDTVRIYGN
jgi:hypothetical protein